MPELKNHELVAAHPFASIRYLPLPSPKICFCGAGA